MKNLNLLFGAFDFSVSKNEEWFFLEINPNGQWAWIEVNNKQNYMTDSLIDLLLQD